jgi:hypothetical protein
LRFWQIIHDILEHLSWRFWIVESVIDRLQGKKQVKIGRTGFLNFRPYNLRNRNLLNHKHVIGTSGYGKSNLLATYFVSLVKQNIPAALIDPHADLATDCLWHLLDSGFFNDPKRRKRLLYIDFGVQDTEGRPSHFLPFNVLKQPFDKYTIARNFVETCRRVWPYLAEGAPQFENILLYSVIVLIDNDLPLTEIEEVLANREYRNKLLMQVSDEKVLSFFQNRYDEWGRDAPLMRESTLNKISLLTFSPVLRNSLSQKNNVLDFRQLMDEGTSVIFNLGGLDEETQKFLGCLISIGFETAALSREDTAFAKRREYHLIMDEFSMFSASSEAALSRILSLARKYRLFLVLAHQTFSQVSERLRGALQNTITVSFRLGRSDAVWMAQQFGQFESYSVKHDVSDQEALQRVHPMYFSVGETYEEWAIELERLFVGDAYVKLRNRTEKIRTDKFPSPATPLEKLRELEESYAQELMTPVQKIAESSPSKAPDSDPGAESTVFSQVSALPKRRRTNRKT